MAKRPKRPLNRPAMAGSPPPVVCVSCRWRKPSQDLFARLRSEDPDRFPADFNGYTFVKWEGSVLALAFVNGRQISAFPMDAKQCKDFAEMFASVGEEYTAELAAAQTAADAPAAPLSGLDFSGEVPEETREAIRRLVQEQIEQQNGGVPVHIELGEVHKSDYLREQEAIVNTGYAVVLDGDAQQEAQFAADRALFPPSGGI